MPSISRLPFLATVLLACAFALGGCGSGGGEERGSPAGGTRVPPADSSRVPPPDSATLAAARYASYNDYGLRIFRQLARTAGAKNLFFSPVSAGIAFSLVTSGATGETRAELAGVLGMRDDPARIDSANAALIRALRSGDVELLVGTSLWARKGAPFAADYLGRARSSYRAEVAEVDFTDPATPDRINQWASRATAGKISSVMDETPDSTRVLALVNAVCFKGKWADPFDPGQTGPIPFHLPGGAAQPRPAMRMTGGYRYARRPGVRALRIPYRGQRFAMLVLLPDSGATLASLVAGLTPERWQALQRAFHPEEAVSLALPRWETRGSGDLVEPMRALGARRVFSQRGAQLGAMFPADYLAARNVWVTEASQRVYVKVDEEGTEAAAATEMALSNDTTVGGPAPIPFTVDRPFLAVIVDEATGALLFIGQVYDPASTGTDEQPPGKHLPHGPGTPDTLRLQSDEPGRIFSGRRSPSVSNPQDWSSPLIKLPTLAASLAALCVAATAAAQTTPELPRTHTPRPTTAQITAADLMTRLYILADDSMMGRESGTIGNVKGTNYVASQFRAIGLRPMGENGTFFQTVPLVNRGVQPGGELSVGGRRLRLGRDYVPITSLGALRFNPDMEAQTPLAVFGGRIGGEMLPASRAQGRLVVLLPPLGPDGSENFRFWRSAAMNSYVGAAGVAIVSLDITPRNVVESLMEPQTEIASGAPAPLPAFTPFAVIVSRSVAEAMLTRPLNGARLGDPGVTVGGYYHFVATRVREPARNVIGVLPGSDPALRGQYVVISAHNDHEGILDAALDHDSIRAYNRVMRPQGANDPVGTPTPQQAARIGALRDSLRRVHGGIRRDRVMNGADDDGSGTVTLMEIAQALAAGPRPRRSILFMSHTAEEKGLYGSQWFTDHPTVPREAIVAALNMDMVGRGRAEDVAGGGPWSIQMIGSGRLSSQLRALIDTLNAGRPNPMAIDWSFDAPGHPLNRYCRSDHYMYARYGIPITYFSTGYSVDYHMASDEPQYIDYEHMARVGAWVRDIALAVANRPQRLVVDGPKPDPNAPCRQ